MDSLVREHSFICVFLDFGSFAASPAEYTNLAGDDKPVINDPQNWNGVILINIKDLPSDAVTRHKHIINICSIAPKGLTSIVFMDEHRNSIKYMWDTEVATVIMTAEGGIAAKSDRFKYLPSGPDSSAKTYLIHVDHVTQDDALELNTWASNIKINLVYYTRIGQQDPAIIRALEGLFPASTFTHGNQFPEGFPL